MKYSIKNSNASIPITKWCYSASGNIKIKYVEKKK